MVHCLAQVLMAQGEMAEASWLVTVRIALNSLHRGSHPGWSL